MLPYAKRVNKTPKYEMQFYCVSKENFQNCFFLSFFILSITLHASATKGNLLPANASVSFIGSENSELSFSMIYENEAAEKFYITILDAEGIILFEGNYNDKKFNKIFKLPSEIGAITFVIRGQKSRFEKKFKVTKEYRIAEEVFVK